MRMVSSKKAKMGLIGCGNISRLHFQATEELQKKGLLELVAVCDIVEAKAREKGDMYKVPYFTDAEKMLKTDLDFIDICTGDYTHHAVAKIAAENGKHVLIEKPMAITIPCCDVIIKACKKAGVYYEVAENYFRTPTERAAKEIVDKGIIGDVLRTYAIDPAPAPPTSQISPFSSHSSIVRLLDMGSHRMSEIRTFAGSEAETVWGVTNRVTPDRIYDEWGHAVAEFENGAVGICEVGMGAVGKVNYREIVGTEGTILISGQWSAGDIHLTLKTQEARKTIDLPVQKISRTIDGREVLQSIVVKTEPKITYKNPYAELSIDEFSTGFADEIMSIANAAVYDKSPEYEISGRKDIEMCIAMYESSLKRCPTKLPIESMTSFEKRVHEAYKNAFGHDPTEI